jgi:WD40 repeat protein
MTAPPGERNSNARDYSPRHFRRFPAEVWTVQDRSDPDNWQSSSELGLPPGARVTSVAFSPDGKVLAAGTSAGLHVWDRVKVAPK